MEKVGDQMQQLKEKLSQWFFNITKFSNELLKDLDKLVGWQKKSNLCKKTGLVNLWM